MENLMSQNPREQITKNFKRYELECPCCHVLPDMTIIRKLQLLRSQCNFPLRITSAYRCNKYNTEVGGSKYSAHKLLGRLIGAFDIGLHERYKHRRFKLYRLAMRLGFNMVELADKHMHIAIVPPKHCMYEKLYSGYRSK